MSIISAVTYIGGQLLRLNSANSEAEDLPTGLSRYSGGHTRRNQPFITGYHHAIFYLPSMIFLVEGSDSSKVLSQTCETFVPHTTNINTSDVFGIGQASASYPVSKTTNREFSLGFRERSGLPVLSAMKMWHSIFNPLFGTSPYGSLSVAPILYKGTVIVAVVKPTSDNGKVTSDEIEEAYIYNGVYPLNFTEDTVTSSDQGSNESVIVNVNFKFDGAPFDLGTLLAKEAVAAAITGSYNDVNNIIGAGL